MTKFTTAISRYIFLSACLLLFFLPIKGWAQPDNDPVCKSELHREAEMQRWKKRSTFSEHTESEFHYDVKYYRTFWEINPFDFYIRGNVTTYFRALEDNFDEIGFDMNAALQIDSVHFRGKRINGIRWDGDRAFIRLDNIKLQSNQLDSITIYYQGPPQHPDGGFELEYHNDYPIIWTLSEPYGSKTWWPCKQSLDDKADSVDIWIKTPRGNKAGSNGILAHSYRQDTFMVYHWMHRYPITPYLVSLAVTNYSEFSFYAHNSPADSFPVLNYVYPSDSATWAVDGQQTKPLMELFARLFGPYPFSKEKYGHAQFGFRGGMEHQTMSSMHNLGFYLNAHELGHQWFGDKITCGTWQDIWLNEGFATYSEGLAAQYLRPFNNDWKNWKRNNKFWALMYNEGSVRVNDTTSDSRIFSVQLTYAKGGYLVHMLRYQCGDSAFFRAIRAYMKDPALAYGFARTPDLQRHLERESGLKLDTFFREWYEGQGYPNYEITWGQNGSLLSIDMTQTTTAPHAVPLFHIAVPVNIWKDGKSSVLYLKPSSNSQNFSFTLPYSIDSLQADPEEWILGKYKVFRREHVPGKDPALFPNPARDEITLVIPQGITEPKASLQITDGLGREVFFYDGPLQTSYTIPVTQFSQGIHILRFAAGQTKFSRKFLKAAD